MNVDFLWEDELTYELRIRNCDLTGPIQDKRICLKGLLQMETLNASGVDAANVPDPTSEQQTCCSKLQEILGMISCSQFTTPDDLKQFGEECNSRLIHLHKRILRLPAQFQGTPIRLLAAAKSCLNQKLESLNSTPVANLIDLEVENNTTSAVSCPTQSQLPISYQSLVDRLNAIQFNHSEILGNALQSSPAPARVAHSTALPVIRPPDNVPVVSRWNIKFNGTSGVNEFIERIQECAFARGISDDQLFRQATDFFTDDALIWFRMVRSSVNSWSELTSRLRSAFLPTNYDLALQEEIRSRTQGPQEKSEVFIAKMENLFSRLSNKPDEETRIAAIQRNLQPHYQRACSLQRIHNLQELISVCKRVEDTEANVASFRNPPFRNSSLLEPDLAYARPNRAQSASNQVASLTRSTQNLTCWNCRQFGHAYQSCKEPLGFFCRGCGRRNTYKPSCPKCSKNVTRVPGSSAVGNSASNELTEKSGQSG